MKYKELILITDMDGTLANSRHEVSPKNKAAIAHFVENGGYFAVATGRTPSNVRPYMAGLTVNAPCILYNGGVLFSWQEQRFLKTRPIEGADLKAYLNHCMNTFPKMCIQVFTQEQLYVITDPDNADEHMVREKQEFEYASLEDIQEKPLIKVILCDEHEHLQSSQELLSQFQLQEKVNSFFSAITYLEIVAKDVSKGTMLSELRNIEQFRGKKVIAAGDFHNDIDMLRTADYGVAPRNAHDEVKAAANEIAVSNDEDLMHDIVFRIVPKMLGKHSG